MKKITLLLVAAVFAIGIQSCSTEETVLEEEVQQTIKKDFPKFGGGDFCAFFVRFPREWTQQDREDFHAYATQEWFNYILRLYDQDCYDIEEWRVPCDELEKIIKTESITNNATDANSKSSDDDPTIIYTLNAKKGYYDTCSDVPLHGRL